MRFTHAHNSARRSLAVLTAAGLAVGGSMLATPAHAASATLKYDCEVPILGPKVFTVVVDTDAPASIAPNTASAALNATAKVTVPEDMVNAMRAALQGESVDGTATVKSTVNGVAAADSSMTIPSTPVPASGALTVTAAGVMGALPAAAEGTVYTLAAGDFTAVMNVRKSDGSASPFTIPCAPQAGQDLTVDTVTVSATPLPEPEPAEPAATTTKLKAKYSAKSKKAKVTVTVATADDSSAAGKVKLTLKKGKKTIKTVTKTVSAAGVAKVTFKKISAKGKYKLTGAYSGSETAKASTGKVSFKVK